MQFARGEEMVFPGFVDLHVHLREPGATDKEDIAHGTQAAAAGGAVAVFDMVNNPGHLTNSPEAVEEKEDIARQQAQVDFGMHYRFQPEENNVGTFKRVIPKVHGLKSMLEISTGSDKQTAPAEFRDGWQEWHRVAGPHQPIILHTERQTVAEALAIAAGEIGHPTHVAHVSNRAELETVMAAKRRGLPVTCGVTLHHLFMDNTDVQDWYQRMKPPLAEPGDNEFLWDHLADIDIVETDHAPHTRAEKELANEQNPNGRDDGPVKSYGVPGLEAVVPLLFTALGQAHGFRSHFRGKHIEMSDLMRMLVRRPREILGLPAGNKGTSVRVRFGQYEFGQDDIYSKCGWSPYSGWLVNAKVVQVDLRGTTIFQTGEFLGRPQGRVIYPENA